MYLNTLQVIIKKTYLHILIVYYIIYLILWMYST